MDDGTKVRKYAAQERYDATHTKQIRLKLNLNTDADILKRLDEVGNTQGYIKKLIRADIDGDKQGRKNNV